MKNLKTYTITGIILVSLLGTLLHFAYEWSGNNFLLGLFVPVNESIWEHTKLLFFPMMLYLFLNKKARAKYPCLTASTIYGALFGALMIIVLFYTYSGITGKHTSLADISIYYVSVIVSFLIIYKNTLNCTQSNTSSALLLAASVTLLYIIFTLFPPNLPLFISY